MNGKLRGIARTSISLLRQQLSWTAITAITGLCVLSIQYLDRPHPPELTYFVLRTNELAATKEHSVTRVTVGIENRSRVPAKNVDVTIRPLSGSNIKVYSKHPTRRTSDDVHTIISLESVPALSTAYVEIEELILLKRAEPLDFRIFDYDKEDIRRTDERRKLHPLATNLQETENANPYIDVVGVHFDFGSVRKDVARSKDLLEPIGIMNRKLSSR